MSQYRKEFREFESEAYWSFPRVLLMTVLVMIALGALGFGGHYLHIWRLSIFAPMEEAIRRDVMIESRAYSEATTRRMYELKLQYETSPNDDAKATIRAMALHEARAFDKGRLPRDLQIFITQLGG